MAAQGGDNETLRRLIADGMDVNVVDANGNTPLKYAAAEPYPETLRLLLAFGADPNQANRRGFTPMHCVAGHGFYEEALEMAQILVDAGADVNARSSYLGFVPLHEVHTVQMIAFLIEKGADPCIVNDAGQTPASYLLEDGKELEAHFLQKCEAQVDRGRR